MVDRDTSAAGRHFLSGAIAVVALVAGPREAAADGVEGETVLARVRSDLRSEATLFLVDGSAGSLRALCRLPCDVDVPRGAKLRVVSGSRSDDFTASAPAGHAIDFVVDERRGEGLRVGGAMLVATGILSALPASAFVSLGGGLGGPDGGAIAWLAVSIAMVTGGIVMIAAAPNGIGASRMGQASGNAGSTAMRGPSEWRAAEVPAARTPLTFGVSF